MTTRYRMQEAEAAVTIEVTGAGERKAELLAAFSDCQAGQCSCPTDEYQKLASMDVEQSADAIKLKLKTKPGEKIDASEIAACLDYTTGKLEQSQTRSRDERHRRLNQRSG